uniref:Uncharacterized protein n=1 Tax=Solanum tuberosum TaxID=4113 RepID=M1CXV8_SOLTU
MAEELCTPSPTGTSPQLSAMRLGDSSSEQSDTMAGTPPLTQHFVHPDVSPSFIATPSATPHDTMWHPAKDAARALKDCVRRLYTHAYHSWSEIPNSICQAMFNNFKTMCTWESRYNLVIGTTVERKASSRLSSWLKKVRDSGECPDWMLPHVFDELDSERRRVAEQERMSETIQQIKEQVMNLARRPTTSAPDDTDDESDEDDYVEPTP